MAANGNELYFFYDGKSQPESMVKRGIARQRLETARARSIKITKRHYAPWVVNDGGSIRHMRPDERATRARDRRLAQTPRRVVERYLWSGIAEESAVFRTELRRAQVADTLARAARVDVLKEHQPLGRPETERRSREGDRCRRVHTSCRQSPWKFARLTKMASSVSSTLVASLLLWLLFASSFAAGETRQRSVPKSTAGEIMKVQATGAHLTADDTILDLLNHPALATNALRVAQSVLDQVEQNVARYGLSLQSVG